MIQYLGLEKLKWAVNKCRPRAPLQTVVSATTRGDVRDKLQCARLEERLLCDSKLRPRRASQTVKPLTSHRSTMPLRIKKNATPQSAPTASQSEGRKYSESSNSEGGSHFGSGEELRSESNVGSGSQSDDSLGGSAESDGGFQDEAKVHKTTETGAKEEEGTVEEDEEITTDDTMLLYVNIHAPDPIARQQLIDCYRSMWTVNRSEEFINICIMTKNGSFKKRAILPETRVVVADNKAFPNIYRTFQFDLFD
uniref:Uncharacterized protein n=1 Tax=Solanum tuberosum TaxID=4113 RepID=M1DDL1_SOLTU